MRRIRGFYSRRTSAEANWLVPIIFFFVGMLIALFLPPVLRQGPDRATLVTLAQIVGGLLMILGGLWFLWSLVDLYVSTYFPAYRTAWHFWANIIAGSLAIAFFAVPASVAFPFILLGYLLRPNVLFRADVTTPVIPLLLGFLLSGIGLACLWFVFSVISAKYGTRPR